MEHYDNILDDGLNQQHQGVGDPVFDVVKWWETRRWEYNIYVGITGGIGTLLFGFSESNIEVTLGLVIIAFIYGICANICYFLGWVPEVFSIIYFGKPYQEHIRLALFRIGLAGSLVLTFLIAIVLPLLIVFGG